MFQFSRAIYRELAPEIDISVDPAAHRLVVDACDRSLTRLATDRRHFARPARTLFQDIRPYFPVTAQAHVLRVVHPQGLPQVPQLLRRTGPAPHPRLTRPAATVRLADAGSPPVRTG